jgi:hypothetical protein
MLILVKPIPFAASLISGGTDKIPAIVFLAIGSTD